MDVKQDNMQETAKAGGTEATDRPWADRECGADC